MRREMAAEGMSALERAKRYLEADAAEQSAYWDPGPHGQYFDEAILRQFRPMLEDLVALCEAQRDEIERLRGLLSEDVFNGPDAPEPWPDGHPAEVH